MVGIPGTIDNDLYGTDSTIGYDTAVNTAVEAVDKIKDTASAHNRLFFVEVMGRDAGFIALRTAIATGAEAVLVPEVETDLTDLEHFIEKDYNPKTSSGIVIVAEGEKSGGAYSIAEKVAQKHPESMTSGCLYWDICREAVLLLSSTGFWPVSWVLPLSML